MATSSKPTSFFAIVLILQFTLCLSVFFNIAVARQVIGFLYLTFVPGFIILKLLKQNKLSIIENILFSAGLSIAFLMLVGLVVNEIGPLVDVRQPLEPAPLISVISCFVFAGAFLCYLKSTGNERSNEITQGILIRSLLLMVLPILSIIGAFCANATGNTSILLLALVAALVMFGIAVFSKKWITPKLYPILVFAIAITLLFHFSLISNYIQGNDINLEYYVFNLTQKSGYWDSAAYFTDPAYGTYNTMLSITVLPTIYSNVLNMEATSVLKAIFPIIFAFVPLALYLLWREKLGVTVALFSAFLLISQTTFYTEMLALARQMIAELFFVLLLVILFSKKLSSRNLRILFVVFSFSLVVSHYTIAIIFFSLISMTWLATYLAKKTSRSLTLSMVVLFFAVMFTWYIYTSASTDFEAMLWTLNWIYSGLGDFFNPASRGQGVMLGLGLEQAQSTLQLVSRIVAYITQFFIAVGFLALILQRKKKDFDFEYFILFSANIAILAMCILLPNFASTLQMTRFYHILLLFLAPLFTIGCTEFLGFASKRKRQFYGLAFTTTLLVAYFLFQTNFMYEVTGSPSWSLPLSRYRLGIRLYSNFYFVTEHQVSGATWLTQHVDSNSTIYADSSVLFSLLSYGAIHRSRLRALTNASNPSIGEFVFLGELNVRYGKVIAGGASYDMWNTTDALTSPFLSAIYSNGNCEIYQTPAVQPG